MSRLRFAAFLAFCAHLLAGAGLALILRYGLETTPDLQDRLAFIVNQQTLWTLAWLAWTAADITILYFYLTFVDAHPKASRMAVLLTVAAVAADLAAQSIEIGVLPPIATRILRLNASPELFLELHRVAVILSGYLANGLYSVAAICLAWAARHAYPAWVSAAGIAVGCFGIALSVAALLNSADGMYWTNALLIPTLLVWLAAVAIIPPLSASLFADQK